MIEIYSSPAKGRERLLQLIHEDELPRDYGGKAPSTAEIILREGRSPTSGDAHDDPATTTTIPHRQIVKLLHVGKEQAFAFSLEANERVELCIYTRSTAKYEFVLLEQQQQHQKEQGGDEKTRVVHKQEINKEPPEKVPKCHEFGDSSALVGPREFTLKVHAADRQHASGKHYFLVIGEVFRV